MGGDDEGISVIVTVTSTKADCAALQRFLKRLPGPHRTRRSRVLRLLLVVLPGIAVVVAINGKHWSGWVNFGLLCVYLAVLQLLISQVAVDASPLTWRLDRSGLTSMNGEGVSTHIPWKSVNSVADTQERLLIGCGPGRTACLPLRCFSSETDADAARKLIATHVVPSAAEVRGQSPR